MSAFSVVFEFFFERTRLRPFTFPSNPAAGRQYRLTLARVLMLTAPEQIPSTFTFDFFRAWRDAIAIACDIASPDHVWHWLGKASTSVGGFHTTAWYTASISGVSVIPLATEPDSASVASRAQLNIAHPSFPRLALSLLFCSWLSSVLSRGML